MLRAFAQGSIVAPGDPLMLTILELDGFMERRSRSTEPHSHTHGSFVFALCHVVIRIFCGVKCLKLMPVAHCQCEPDYTSFILHRRRLNHRGTRREIKLHMANYNNYGHIGEGTVIKPLVTLSATIIMPYRVWFGTISEHKFSSLAPRATHAACGLGWVVGNLLS